MTKPAIPTDLEAKWATLERRMRRAAWSSVAVIVLIAVPLLLLILPNLLTFWIEVGWVVLLGGMTFVLLVSQWRLASFQCPRCNGSWLAGRWFVANPFSLYRTHCINCGIEIGERNWTAYGPIDEVEI